MFFRAAVFVVVVIVCHVLIDAKDKHPFPFVQKNPAAHHDNPNYIKDRQKVANESKPQMPPAWNDRNHLPMSVAWMDYCEPYHCDDYHKPACGLNRDHMKFKMFQSQCHIILNNLCHYHLGLMKFDIIDVKFCYTKVMNLRLRCPAWCGTRGGPVCAVCPRGHPRLFVNSCALEMTNCKLGEYEEVPMEVCDEEFRRPEILEIQETSQFADYN